MRLKKAAEAARSAISAICQVLNVFGIAVLVMLTCLTVADVAGRYLFRQPILGTTELTEFMMATIVFMCIGWCAIQGKMIRVDLLLMHLSEKTQAVLNSITLFIGFGVTVIVTWRSVLESIVIQNSPRVSSLLGVPVYPFMWILTVGFALLSLVMIAQIIQNIAKAVSR